MRGYGTGTCIRAFGLLLAVLGFAIMAAQVISYMDTGEWKDVAIQSLFDALRMRLQPSDSLVGSIMYAIKDTPLGLALIGSGMIATVIGGVIIECAKSNFNSRLLDL